LELFKKTLPSSSSSFVQAAVTQASQKSAALDALKRVYDSVPVGDRAGLDLISLALHGKKSGLRENNCDD